MTKIIASMIASMALISAAATAAPYLEQGDAGHTALTQSVGNNTTSIHGNLGANDAVDIFKFKWNGGYFQANSYASFDTMLFIFNGAGNTLAFNDDYPYCCNSQLGLDLVQGDYMLAINQYSYNYGGNLAGFADAGDMSGPSASYTVNFSSAVNSTEVPEPATLGLLGLAALGLAAARRRKQA